MTSENGNGHKRKVRNNLTRAQQYQAAVWVEQHWDAIEAGKLGLGDASARLTEVLGKPIAMQTVTRLTNGMLGKSWPVRRGSPRKDRVEKLCMQIVRLIESLETSLWCDIFAGSGIDRAWLLDIASKRPMGQRQLTFEAGGE
jgi:hypothetical protein